MGEPTKPKPGTTTIPAMDPNSQIVSKLKALYSAVEQEPLPDAFLDLLEQLDAVEKTRRSPQG